MDCGNARWGTVTCLPVSLSIEVLLLQSEERKCTFQMRLESSMSSPVYVYYELDDYFQNHRRLERALSTATSAKCVSVGMSRAEVTSSWLERAEALKETASRSSISAQPITHKNSMILRLLNHVV